MKYLKLYENKKDTFYMLDIKGWFKNEWRNNINYDSDESFYKTKEDLENFTINLINKTYSHIMKSNEFTDDFKNTFQDIYLDTFEECNEFFIAFNEDYCDNSEEYYLYSHKITPTTNIEIDEDIKMRIDARKYNL